MTKWLLIGLGGFYLYNQLQQKHNAAMADRNALLAMLTPDQRAQLLQGVQAIQTAASGVINSTAQALATAQANVPKPVPLQ